MTQFETLHGIYRKDLDGAPVLFNRETDEWSLKPGEFCWWRGLCRDGDGVRISFRQPMSKVHAILWYCPPGEPRPPLQAPVSVREEDQDKKGSAGTYWWWNGDREKPTLKPSIGVPAIPPYTWHGYLTDGVFVGV